MIEHWAALLSRRVAGPQFLQTDVVATHVVGLCNSMQAPLFLSPVTTRLSSTSRRVAPLYQHQTEKKGAPLATSSPPIASSNPIIDDKRGGGSSSFVQAAHEVCVFSLCVFQLIERKEERSC